MTRRLGWPGIVVISVFVCACSSSDSDNTNRDGSSSEGDGSNSDVRGALIHQGNYDIKTLADVTKLSTYEEVTGDVNAVETDLTEIVVTGLRKAGQLRVIDNARLQKVSFPDLEEGGQLHVFRNPKLVMVNLKNYDSGTSSKGDFSITDCPMLTNIDISSLTSVGDLFRFRNTGFAAIELPKLKRTANFIISDNAIVSSLNAPVLAQVEDFRVTGNPRLPTCVAKSLLDQLKANGWTEDQTREADISGNLEDSCWVPPADGGTGSDAAIGPDAGLADGSLPDGPSPD